MRNGFCKTAAASPLLAALGSTYSPVIKITSGRCAPAAPRTFAEDRKAARRSAGFSPKPQLLRLSMRNLLSVHGRSNLHPATNKYSLHRPGREHVVLSKLSEQAGN